jgi:hypothetical protein
VSSSTLEPTKRVIFLTALKESHLRMQEHLDRTDQPTLPFVRRNHGDAIDLLLMRFDESGALFKGGQIFPALQTRGLDQQPELACCRMMGSICRANSAKSPDCNLVGATTFRMPSAIRCAFIIASLPSGLAGPARKLSGFATLKRTVGLRL